MAYISPIELIGSYKDLVKPLYFIIYIYWRFYLSYLILLIGPQSRTLQPVRGEGYEPAYKSRANAKTHPRLGREVVVFQKSSKKLYTGRVSPSKNNLLLVL